MRGIVIARGKRFHRSESADAHRGDGRFGAAANHHFGRAALNNFEGIADGVRRSGARRGGGGIGPARAVANGNMSGGKIHDGATE